MIPSSSIPGDHESYLAEFNYLERITGMDERYADVWSNKGALLSNLGRIYFHHFPVRIKDYKELIFEIIKLEINHYLLIL